jgi:hypothetical protein
VVTELRRQLDDRRNETDARASQLTHREDELAAGAAVLSDERSAFEQNRSEILRLAREEGYALGTNEVDGGGTRRPSLANKVSHLVTAQSQLKAFEDETDPETSSDHGSFASVTVVDFGNAERADQAPEASEVPGSESVPGESDST